VTKRKTETAPDETPEEESPPDESPPQEDPPEGQDDPLHAAQAAAAANTVQRDGDPSVQPPPLPEPLVSPTPQESPTPPSYAVGAIKKQPEGLAVAIRTNILDPDGLKDWGIMTVDRGGHYGGYEEVANWADIG